MAHCEACEDLRQYAQNFLLNGITDKECKSLQENTGLNPNLSGALHKNCEDLNDINDCLMGSLGDELPAYDICDLKEYIDKLMKNQYNINKALICSDCGLWKKIEDLYERLDLRYKPLTKGVDYTIKFYNGFYNIDQANKDKDENDNDLNISVAETSNILSVKIATSTQTQLKNDKLVNVKMRHAKDEKTYDVSWIYGIKFIGKYAIIDDCQLIDGGSTASGIWNVRPAELRASWQANIHAFRGIDNKSILTTLTAYYDGYNDEFTIYNNNNMYLHSGNHTKILTYQKK